jgi:uncharacterized protein (TIGR03435 family)
MHPRHEVNALPDVHFGAFFCHPELKSAKLIASMNRQKWLEDAMRQWVLLLVAISLVSALATPRLHGQSRPVAADQKEPAFEVTSVKANTSGAAPVGAGRFSNGEFRTTNIPLRLLMRQAFQRMQNDDLVGGPSWLDTDRWDIAAKADSPTADMLPMIRTLLADRFKLITHHETRDRSIYALVIARRDGQLGPSLRPSTGPSDFRDVTGAFTAHAVPIRILVDVLAVPAQRTVIDRTGLAGTYDVDLHWAPLFAGRADVPPTSDGPSIFTAVQEQLGLKLESTKAPVDVLVIDSAEKPTPD